jgi:hypothetical protein
MQRSHCRSHCWKHCLRSSAEILNAEDSKSGNIPPPRYIVGQLPTGTQSSRILVVIIVDVPLHNLVSDTRVKQLCLEFAPSGYI